MIKIIRDAFLMLNDVVIFTLSFGEPALSLPDCITSMTPRTRFYAGYRIDPCISAPLLRRLLLKAGKRSLRWNGQFQTRHSLISTTPQIGNHEFNWVATLEAHWPAIRAELDRLLEHPEDIPAFHQISPDQKRISKGDNWKTFGLFVYGQRVDENCAICPHTAQAVSEIPGMRTAMFSILKPHYHIVPHKGPTRAVVRAHRVDRAKGSGKAVDPR